VARNPTPTQGGTVVVGKGWRLTYPNRPEKAAALLFLQVAIQSPSNFRCVRAIHGLTAAEQHDDYILGLLLAGVRCKPAQARPVFAACPGLSEDRFLRDVGRSGSTIDYSLGKALLKLGEVLPKVIQPSPYTGLECSLFFRRARIL